MKKVISGIMLRTVILSGINVCRNWLALSGAFARLSSLLKMKQASNSEV